MVSIRNDNWGSSSISFLPNWTSDYTPNGGFSAPIVILDPLGDARAVPGTTTEDEYVEKLKHRIRHKLMAELTSEFTTWNDDLLRQLAR
jgi:hypothetical protein